jgi:mono/diheme cytochrome c family protein
MTRTAAVSTFLVLFGASLARGDEGQVSFNRDVRPILADNCFACHGPDASARQADLRLDVRAAATADRGGYPAIVPGDPAASELMVRVTAADEGLRMPPAEAHEPLSPDEINILRHWIAGGAEYEPHWAFVPPSRPPLPDVEREAWPRNASDHFVLRRLEEQGLEPSPEADRYTLVRRVYLDLIGLPPTPEEADAFVRDDDPQAYDRLVDRLLASPHYGERWARLWLDLARYADTNGYEKDRPRSIWPYRDCVIEALNADMPYDRFTIEQLAGDMLPGAGLGQRIATGFHRNTMLNEEGGIDPLEYRFYAMVDRVATTGTVWLGLTTGCAQCHTHKYDPISHTEYYGLMALLDNADEPNLIVPDAEIARRRQELEAKIANLEQDLPNHFPPAEGHGTLAERRRKNPQRALGEWIAEQQATAASWTTLRPVYIETNLPRLEVLQDGSIFSTGDITKRDRFTLRFDLSAVEDEVKALRLEVLPDDRLPARGPGRAYYEGRLGDFFLSEVTATLAGAPIEFAAASHSFGKISIGSGTADATNVIDGEGSTGWSTAGREGEAHQLVLNLAQPLAPEGELEITMLFERHFAASLGRFRWSVTSHREKVRAKEMPVEVEAILARDRATWTDEQAAAVERQYLRVAPELAEARQQIDALRNEMPEFPTTLIFRERPDDNPRVTHRHHRGEYLNPQEPVAPGIPEVLAATTTDPPTNRLEFARWLVSEENPLAARVAVNRAWQAFFGRGLVVTSGDFGTQGEPPTHPELLDWLAREFVEQGWSLKSLHRLIVTSATYRQSSRVSPELLAADPENRWLARGPRHRADAEMVRDIGLRASGLLSPQIGGPSVYPPQPESVTALAYGGYQWPTSTGDDRYRRSLYTFSKRTAPFAAYAVFDAPTGENCVVRRDRSNTPLQALTLLNHEMFLEMARALAHEATKLESLTTEERVTFIFRRLLTRPPSERELAAVLDFHAAQQARVDGGELTAAEIADDENASAELAAWVLVARAIMNLDETVTRQ